MCKETSSAFQPDLPTGECTEQYSKKIHILSIVPCHGMSHSRGEGKSDVCWGSGGYIFTRNNFSLKSNEQTALCCSVFSYPALKSGNRECKREQYFLTEGFAGKTAGTVLCFKAAKLHN